MQNLTVSEDDDHLGPSRWLVDFSVLKVTFQKDKDKDEEKQISGSTVTSALNAAQLTL